MGIPAFTGCTKGSYCSAQAATKVGDNQTQIYHRTVTTLTGQGPNYTGSKTETYIISKNAAGVDEWVLAATTIDGGKTQTFTDKAGADLKKSFAPGGNLSKNVQAQVQSTLEKGGEKQGLVSLPGTSGSLEKISPTQQQKLGIISESKATDGVTTPGVGNDPVIIGGDQKNPDQGLGGNLKYPLDMAANQDHILFTMVETLPKALGEGGTGGSFGLGKRTKNTNRSSLGTVILPIQSGIVDANSVGWGQGELDPLSIAGAKIFRDAAMKGLNTVGENVGNAVEDITKSADAAKKGITYAAMADALGKPANELLARTTGSIINSNLELLFNGVTLRPFSFTFRMSARDKDEGEQIQKIIYFFKKGMAAKQTKSGFFLKQPYVFDIQYKFNGGEHPGMNKIKTCALQNFGVNYTPDGQYMSHADGVLSAYEITMQFTELDPLYFDDYDGTHKIGY